MNVTFPTFLPRDRTMYYRHLFCKSAAIICQQTWSALNSKLTFVTFEQQFSYNHT